LLPRGCGAVFSFNLKGDRAAGRRFIENLALFSHLANVGDARSLVIHPASTTHFRMDREALQRAGITEGTIRLSIGLEDVDDLIDDLKRGLKAARKSERTAPTAKATESVRAVAATQAEGPAASSNVTKETP
jgi:O-acetylhomoserine (thiol)-lyase